MATTFISTAVTGGQSVGSGDQLVVTTAGSITNGAISNTSPTSEDTIVKVYGSLFSQGNLVNFVYTSGGFAASTDYAGHLLEIGSTGLVVGTGPNSPGINFRGTDNTFLNRGEISVFRDSVSSDGGNLTFTNFGSITSTLGEALDIIDAATGRSLIFNSGTMQGSGAIRVDLGTFGAVEIFNSGTLIGTGRDGVFIDDAGSGAVQKITNLGTIIGAAGWDAIDSRDAANRIINEGRLEGRIDLGASDDVVENSGIIDGVVELGDGNNTFRMFDGRVTGAVEAGLDQDVFLISGGTFQDELTTSNSDDVIRISDGVFLGDIATGNNDDTLVISGGSFAGNIDAGADNDTISILGGSVDGVVIGGSGDDTFRIEVSGIEVEGGFGEDTVLATTDITAVGGVETIRLQGAADAFVVGDDNDNAITGNLGRNDISAGSGNDFVDGRAGDDFINGEQGDDILRGGFGNDEMLGGIGNDIMLGDAGDDLLNGRSQDDVLRGLTGDDILIGGTGADILEGGIGADLFVFEAVSETGNTGATADKIRDFGNGADQIDLSAIGGEAFAFLGTSGFTGGGGMEVRYTTTTGGSLLVRLDEDGDGSQDGFFVVNGVSALTADDFAL